MITAKRLTLLCITIVMLLSSSAQASDAWKQWTLNYNQFNRKAVRSESLDYYDNFKAQLKKIQDTLAELVKETKKQRSSGKSKSWLDNVVDGVGGAVSSVVNSAPVQAVASVASSVVSSAASAVSSGWNTFTSWFGQNTLPVKPLQVIQPMHQTAIASNTSNAPATQNNKRATNRRINYAHAHIKW